MYDKLKGFIDLFISVILLLLLLPVFILISLAIMLESGLPVFFSQERVGKNWERFRILKFRTMINGAENIGPSVTSDNDERITTVGKFLRQYKLDELPQLINVIKGEMSIVGPRPEVLKFAQVFSKEYSDILKVKPGISDYASIKYREESMLINQNKDIEEIYTKKILPLKISLYYKYLSEKSILTDFKIIYSTVRVLIK
jgi:lipopolysaccharide/colanic/teichoic acid biosynthesis glycosyltransferase